MANLTVSVCDVKKTVERMNYYISLLNCNFYKVLIEDFGKESSEDIAKTLSSECLQQSLADLDSFLNDFLLKKTLFCKVDTKNEEVKIDSRVEAKREEEDFSSFLNRLSYVQSDLVDAVCKADRYSLIDAVAEKGTLLLLKLITARTGYTFDCCLHDIIKTGNLESVKYITQTYYFDLGEDESLREVPKPITKYNGKNVVKGKEVTIVESERLTKIEYIKSCFMECLAGDNSDVMSYMLRTFRKYFYNYALHDNISNKGIKFIYANLDILLFDARFINREKRVAHLILACVRNENSALFRFIYQKERKPYQKHLVTDARNEKTFLISCFEEACEVGSLEMLKEVCQLIDLRKDETFLNDYLHDIFLDTCFKLGSNIPSDRKKKYYDVCDWILLHWKEHLTDISDYLSGSISPTFFESYKYMYERGLHTNLVDIVKTESSELEIIKWCVERGKETGIDVLEEMRELCLLENIQITDDYKELINYYLENDLCKNWASVIDAKDETDLDEEDTGLDEEDKEEKNEDKEEKKEERKKITFEQICDQILNNFDIYADQMKHVEKLLIENPSVIDLLVGTKYSNRIFPVLPSPELYNLLIQHKFRVDLLCVSSSQLICNDDPVEKLNFYLDNNILSLKRVRNDLSTLSRNIYKGDGDSLGCDFLTTSLKREKIEIILKRFPSLYDDLYKETLECVNFDFCTKLKKYFSSYSQNKL